MIYLDNAATSCQKPEEVIKAVTDAMGSLGNSGRGAHGASLDASRLIFDTRRLIAEFFSCRRSFPGGLYSQFHSQLKHGHPGPV